jgi:hypothetical protein
VSRRATDEIERAVTDLHDDARVGVDGDHGGFIEEDAALTCRQARVRGANVKRNVYSHE